MFHDCQEKSGYFQNPMRYFSSKYITFVALVLGHSVKCAFLYYVFIFPMKVLFFERVLHHFENSKVGILFFFLFILLLLFSQVKLHLEKTEVSK